MKCQIDDSVSIVWTDTCPNSPTELRVTGPNGAQFGIRDGTVYYFATPGSFFHEQDPSNVARYAGSCLLSTNQVLELCSNMLQRLIKRDVPLSGVPKVRLGGVHQGKPIPFFLIEWPKLSAQSHVNAADIEVDARTGRIVFLHLLDDAFFDPIAAERINTRVTGSPIEAGVNR